MGVLEIQNNQSFRFMKTITIMAFCFCLLPLAEFGADSTGNIPPAIQKGLTLYERGGADVAFDAWQHGGLLDGDARVASKVRAFKEITATIGNYRASEVIALKEIGKSSRIVYIAMNFKRGAVYGNFLLYKGESDWVVQNMFFSTRPEAIMPWLALEKESEPQ
jgi:hypothetical protein